MIYSAILILSNHLPALGQRTATKKLLVPSLLSNMPGKSFNHVSSPYIICFPVPLFFICASHVSCVARELVVSDSAKLRIRSRNEGIEPVVMALTRGIVIVGAAAYAVYGRAEPSRMRLVKH